MQWKLVIAECLLHQNSLRWEVRDMVDRGYREGEIQAIQIMENLPSQ